jgi:hypothetical protein
MLRSRRFSGDCRPLLHIAALHAAVVQQIPVDFLSPQRSSPDVCGFDLDVTVVRLRPLAGADAEPHDRRDHQHDQAGPEDAGQRAFGC